jgi:ribonuclease Z
VKLATLALIGMILPAPAFAQSHPIRVILLGTGTPNPRIERLGPSTLVEAGGKRLVFDVGRGTTIRLEESGIRSGTVTATFITHFHSDHTNGLPDLWLSGWLPPFGGRTEAFRVVGPTGLNDLVRGLQLAYAGDIRIRIAEERLPPSGIAIQAHEFARDSVVFDEAGVRVKSFLVDHGGELKPAYGYRVEYAGHSVVISGDTRYSENLIRNAVGADVLLHEVAMAPEEIRNQPAVQFILAHHTSPADAARVFAQTKPRLAVFTHFAFPPNRNGKNVTPADVLAETSKSYMGRMEAGEDLMEILVGETIEVRRRAGERK